MIGGSPASIRADASRVRTWASTTEDDARRALDASQVDWESTAAQRWRESLRDQLTDVSGTASAMRDVAAEIDRLADALEDRQNRLASLLEQAGKTVNDVRDALVDGATDALDVAQGFADDAADVARDLADGAGDAVRDLGRGVAGGLPMTDTLQRTDGSLRVHLDEPTWASVVASADLSPTSLDPLTGVPASTDPVDPAVREAAILALGATPIVLDLVTGHGDRGVLARIGTDGRAAASAVRALIPRPGTTPQPAPGIELSTTLAQHVVGEVMRLFPPVGLTRQVSAEPLVLPQEVALPAVRALTDDDVPVALRALRTAGVDHVPDVLDALGRGPIASATLTLTALGRVVVQQWLCTDVGWVALGVTAGEVTHTVRSRDETHTDVVALVAGAFDALTRLTGEAHDG